MFKTSVTKPLLGFHCRVKYIKYGPYFQAFLTSKHIFLGFYLSLIHYIFLYFYIKWFPCFNFYSSPPANACQHLSYTTNHSEGLFVTSLNSPAVLPAHRLYQGPVSILYCSHSEYAVDSMGIIQEHKTKRGRREKQQERLLQLAGFRCYVSG